jgi:hypothetical protein
MAFGRTRALEVQAERDIESASEWGVVNLRSAFLRAQSRWRLRQLYRTSD